jgi:hypothetical protein
VSSNSTGRLIIRAIPDPEVARKVVTFICRHGGNPAPETIAARLATLPLVLSSSMPAASGTRIAAALMELGADAVFLPHQEAVPPQPAVAAPQTGVPANPSHQLPASAQSSAAPPPRPPSPERRPATVPQQAGETLLRSDAPILLLYAFLASLVAMASPVFLLCYVPLALYAIHRACVSLALSVWLRAMFMVGVFVPLANTLLLVVLWMQCTLVLRRQKSTGTGTKDSGGVALAMRLACTPLMLLALSGVSSGILPAEFTSLTESVESQLAKEVKRVAKQFPRTVNKEMRIDSVTAGPDRLLTYNCTMLQYPADRIDSNRLRDAAREKLLKEVCASFDLKLLLKKEVTIAYAFSGNDGKLVTTVTINGCDCRDRAAE